APLEVARKSVSRNRLPRCSVRDELSVARPDTGIGVEGTEPDSLHLRVVRALAPEARAAGAAEDLSPPCFRLVRPEELAAAQKSKGAWSDPRLRRCRCSGAALAPCAMAVRRTQRHLVELESHAAAEAAAAQRKSRHAASLGATGDEHVLEVLSGPAPGAPVHVAAISEVDSESRALEDLRIQGPPVVDHDHDRPVAAQTFCSALEDGRDPVDVRGERSAARPGSSRADLGV